MEDELNCNYISRLGDLPIYIRRGEHPDRERQEMAAIVNQREVERRDMVPGDSDVDGWMSSDSLNGDPSGDILTAD